MLTGHCHCGNISFSTNHTPDSLTECNCSICRRYGARYAYFKTAEVSLSIRDAEPIGYCWGDKQINFMHCPHCGCMTHYTGTEHAEPGIDRIAVNVRMCEPDSLVGIKLRHFDGADSWTFLD